MIIIFERVKEEETAFWKAMQGVKSPTHHIPHASTTHKNGKSHFPLSTLIGRVCHLVQSQWTMPLSTLVLPNCFLS
jgi:hypothetical protein